MFGFVGYKLEGVHIACRIILASPEIRTVPGQADDIAGEGRVVERLDDRPARGVYLVNRVLGVRFAREEVRLAGARKIYLDGGLREGYTQRRRVKAEKESGMWRVRFVVWLSAFVTLFAAVLAMACQCP